MRKLMLIATFAVGLLNSGALSAFDVPWPPCLPCDDEDRR